MSFRYPSEEAFEREIVGHLVQAGGYEERAPGALVKDLALMSEDFLGFVEESQPREWRRLETRLGDKLRETVERAFDAACRTRGVLRVLHNGFKVHGVKVKAAFYRPAHGFNPEERERYARNRLCVARQVHYDPKNPRRSLDLVLFLNGIPLATAELKNELTGQRSRDARAQFQETRDPRAPIFRYKERALVHFAVSTDDVLMTTRLAGADTAFLPFNRGTEDGGAGNPAVEGKVRTAYLWEDVWNRESLLELVQHFLHVETKSTDASKPGGGTPRDVLFFPRYHQLRCVRRLLEAARRDGPGSNYLVQHSAGSGKTKTIAWLAHRLATLHTEDDRKVYDQVVVITDRQVLDQQLQDVIAGLLRSDEKGVVQLIEKGKSKSGQLAAALEGQAKIVVCTLHSFGEVAQKLESSPHRTYAVVVDEAHSSQSGDMAATLKEILGAGSIAQRFDETLAELGGSDAVDAVDQAALWAALARGPQANLSYFAFTATPKAKTLELFGHRDESGQPAAFDLYSMRQAIEEGFILNVLRGYTTYKAYYELVKAVRDDPELDTRKAAAALARFASLHPVNIEQKTEVMIEHFRHSVAHQLEGRAKAMVVTPSRLHAVRYVLAFRRYLAEHDLDREIGVLVAFSDKVVDPDDPSTQVEPYTEPRLNRDPSTGRPIPETALTDAFDGPDFQILIVADKYQTGFNQPKLVAMYVDKRLDGLQAVQTLSRLNRIYPGKERTMVLDFVNDPETIRESFQTFFQQVEIEEVVDPQRLHQLEGELDAFHLYTEVELNRCYAAFVAFREAGGKEGFGGVSSAVDNARDRFKVLPEDEAEAFRDRLIAFCRLYAFISQVVPFDDPDLEKRFVFGRFLLRKLPPKGETSLPVDLTQDVDLRSYRLEELGTQDLELREDETGVVRGPVATGTGAVGALIAPLSEILAAFNARFGTKFGNEDLVAALLRVLAADPDMQRSALVNGLDNFVLSVQSQIQKQLLDRHEENGEFVEELLSDPDKERFFVRRLAEYLFHHLRSTASR